MREMEILKGLEGGENMAVQFVDHLLALGLRKKASDIHLEPGEEQMTVRMRTDGRLKVCAAVEMRHHPMILTRVKVMADMDIAEKRLPQDGHIRASIQGKPADLRVSVIPTIHGEKAVLRFLNTDTVIDSPETFGMSEENYGKVLDILKRPNGIFYITGPTGSGKTTTLYMILERLAELPVNIVAIEDPVEKHIRGISQMQVNTQAGLTFETGLRAALRQDPDVIMVGETRDSQTLKTSVRAAVTGHLVLSTLHTNNAAGTVVRMLDMGAEPYLAASSLSGILAQRLVRKICPDCKTVDDRADAHRRAAEGMCGCGNEAPSHDPYPCEGHGGYGHCGKAASPGRPHKGFHPGEAGGSAGQRDPNHTRRKGSPPLSEYRYSHRQPGNLRHE